MTTREDFINEYIQLAKKDANIEFNENSISDGWHTFDELYEFRKLYNAALFNEWAKNGLYNVHKSVRHYDGEYCFNDSQWFIVVAILPSGQISNHYKRDDWNLFNIPAKDRALFPWDGHTAKDVAERLAKFLKS